MSHIILAFGPEKKGTPIEEYVAGPEGIEPSTFGCPSAVKSFSLAPTRPLLYLSRAHQLA